MRRRFGLEYIGGHQDDDRRAGAGVREGSFDIRGRGLGRAQHDCVTPIDSQEARFLKVLSTATLDLYRIGPGDPTDPRLRVPAKMTTPP